MINNVILVGRMARDADFINCVIWRQQAEKISKLGRKRNANRYYGTYSNSQL